MTHAYEEIAKIIDPEDGALNYIARQKAKHIIKLGYRKNYEVPKVYNLEKIIARLKRENKFTVNVLAREIHKQLENKDAR